MTERQWWASLCRFHGNRALRPSALSWQSPGVWVPARPPSVGVAAHRVCAHCRSAKGPARVQAPLPSSVGEGHSELWPLGSCRDP